MLRGPLDFEAIPVLPELPGQLAQPVQPDPAVLPGLEEVQQDRQDQRVPQDQAVARLDQLAPRVQQAQEVEPQAQRGQPDRPDL